MNVRRTIAVVKYNGQEVTIDTSGSNNRYNTSVTYTDPASDSSDSISLSIADRDHEWIGPYMPAKGDTVTLVIEVYDWDQEGDQKRLDCGEFILDDMRPSGPPTRMTIGAVSAPADESFTSKDRTQTWENVTLQQVASEIAGRYGLSLVYDADDVTIAILEQSEKKDSVFLQELCKNYGLCMKIYSHKLVIFDREQYKSRASVATFDVSDMVNWSWNTTLAGTYSGGDITYTDPDTEEDIVFEISGEGRLLSINEKADNVADAEKKLRSAIANANHGMTQISFTVMGNPSIVATQCVDITGLSRLNGKYYIDQVAHAVSNRYTTKYTASLVE